MNGDDGTKRDAKEILLKEYDSLSESVWKNEQTGETRVNWFIGIVTLGIGGILKFIAADHRPRGPAFYVIMLACLSGLLAFGLVTFCRIVNRNKRTDRMTAELDLIRKIFRVHYDAADVLLCDPAFTRASGGKRTRKFGGLADLVLTINSLLSGAFSFALAFSWYGRPTRETYAVGVFGSIVAFSLQYYLSRRRDFTHAGGVVYRLDDDATIKYLLTTPKIRSAAKEEWILPKGHIDRRDATAEDAAVREVKEETGIEGRVLAPLDLSVFCHRRKNVTVMFYLMEAVNDGGSSEGRSVEWLPFDEAIQKATYPTTRQMLRLAELTRRSLN